MRVLITCGPTWVPIDRVRVISNRSTGEMGHALAKAFLKRKAHVTLLEGPMAFDELKSVLKKEAQKGHDVVIHAAAVSDFKLKTPRKGKISSYKSLVLKLTPTPKIIALIKKWSPRTFLVGFKLEPGLTRSRVRRLTRELFRMGCDLVVANTVENGYKGFIVDADGHILAQASNKKKIAELLVKLLIRPYGQP
ncbi:MAG TPA: phosphopantothenoylcysteine decarboxylase [Candidatus Omnitrophota bacterium]|nr:phosphopantothenoylcysteine decarboxylase [Candidatus Omnitrophota bacterium]